MNITQRKELKHLASRQVSTSPEVKKILLIFCGLTLGLAFVTTAGSYVLGLQIDQTGGLSNMGTRAILSTLGRMLPIVHSVLALCLNLGFTAAMLRLARGQYTSHRTLKLGFDRFWPLLRLTLLRGGLFLSVGFLSMYLGTMLFFITPFSDPVTELLEPVLSQATLLSPEIFLDDMLYYQLTDLLIPCAIICLVLYVLLVVPMWYRYRLAEYILIDKPSYGALQCLHESKLLMRKNRLNLFRLDLSLWFYHAAAVLIAFIAYGDVLLALAGISLPLSETLSYFLFYILYLLAQFVLCYFLRCKVDTTYALAYDSLLPQESKDSGVVLGNIFQM